MANVIIIAILVVLVGGAVYYLYKAKKSGRKCIGCSCSGGSACTCDSKTTNKKQQ